MNEKNEKKIKKTSSTTRKGPLDVLAEHGYSYADATEHVLNGTFKVAAPTTRSLQDTKDLVVFMKEQGVIQFTAGELAVEFNPYATTTVMASEESPEQVRARLFKEIKDVNKDADEIENWSV